MLIKKMSSLTKKVHELEIPVTMEQIALWQRGVLIQRAMSNISEEHREFLMSGITPEEWNETFVQDEKN